MPVGWLLWASSLPLLSSLPVLQFVLITWILSITVTTFQIPFTSSGPGLRQGVSPTGGCWREDSGMVSNTWKPLVWCVWKHSIDSVPAITVSPSSPIKVLPTPVVSPSYKSKSFTPWNCFMKSLCSPSGYYCKGKHFMNEGGDRKECSLLYRVWHFCLASQEHSACIVASGFLHVFLRYTLLLKPKVTVFQSFEFTATLPVSSTFNISAVFSSICSVLTSELSWFLLESVWTSLRRQVLVVCLEADGLSPQRCKFFQWATVSLSISWKPSLFASLI